MYNYVSDSEKCLNKYTRGQDKDSEKKFVRNEENLKSGMSSVGIQTSLTTLTHALNTSSDCLLWMLFHSCIRR